MVISINIFMVLALPLVWATGYRFLNAAWRLAAVAGGLAVLFTALQITWRRQRVGVVLYSLVACTVVQLVIAGQQLLMREAAWLPLYGRRAYGTFFQPNVQASFLATGLAVTLILLLLPVFTVRDERTVRHRRRGLRLLLALTVLMLVWIQSRTSWLGASVLLLWHFGARDRQIGFTAGAPDSPDTGALHRRLYAGLALLCLVGAVGAGYAVQGSQALTQVEKFSMEDISPLVALPPFSRALHQERVHFDEQINALLTYNHTHDATLLARYQSWAQGYLYRRIDKNVYATLIQILQHQRQNALAEQYRRNAHRFFPQDTRFFPPHNDHREMP